MSGRVIELQEPEWIVDQQTITNDAKMLAETLEALAQHGGDELVSGLTVHVEGISQLLMISFFQSLTKSGQTKQALIAQSRQFATFVEQIAPLCDASMLERIAKGIRSLAQLAASAGELVEKEKAGRADA